jgi:hypothetical protein
MDPDKARDFWQTVLDDADTLCAVLDETAVAHGLEEGLQRIGRIVQTLRDAAAEIDPLLSVEVDQIPVDDGAGAVLRIAVSCNHDPEGIEAVLALVAAAPPMPPRIQACAFAQPMPERMARELGSIEVVGNEVPLHRVRYMAEPNGIAPGTFDVVCFVPGAAATAIDPQEVPGALVANIVLSMGIGELRVMTRVASVGIAVTDHPPPGALSAWDLTEVIDSAQAH